MPRGLPNWVFALLAAASVPLAAVIVWGAWVYTTWALQARTAGWVSALAILSVVAGVWTYFGERS